MTDNIRRIACVNDNCGTFPVDEQQYQRYRQTGQPFCCPAGHEQRFTEPLFEKQQKKINQLKQKVDQLENRSERFREMAHARWDDYREERTHRKHAESLLFENVDGVLEVTPEQYKWSCSCGSHGQKAFDDEGDARSAYRDHVRRSECDGSAEQVIEA